MLPYITLFEKIIPMYGLMGVVGGLLGLLYLLWRSPAMDLNREDSVYIYVMGIVGAVIGAKLVYLLTIFPAFLRDLSWMIDDFSAFAEKYIRSGFVFYGGLLGGIGAAWRTAHSYRLCFSSFFPVLVPAVILVGGVGRLGCFCAGCCYGVEATILPGVVFPIGGIAPAGVPLVPVQLIEFSMDLVLFAVMAWFSASPQRVKYTLPVYLLLYAPIRFFLEFWRGDAARGVLLGLSTSQWISGLVFLCAGFSLLKQKSTMNSAVFPRGRL